MGHISGGTLQERQITVACLLAWALTATTVGLIIAAALAARAEAYGLTVLLAGTGLSMSAGAAVAHIRLLLRNLERRWDNAFALGHDSAELRMLR